MSSLSGQILTILLACPAIGAVPTMLLRSHTASRIAALSTSVLTLVIAVIAALCAHRV